MTDHYTEYRINFTIERTHDGDDFHEIGFGSSGTWDTISAAEHDMGSIIANLEWETSPGMPDPDTFKETQ